LFFSFLSGGSAGGISLTQLAEVMTSLNITFPNIDKVFELFDENSDGSVDQRELIMGLALLRETPTDEHFRYVSQVIIQNACEGDWDRYQPKISALRPPQDMSSYLL
jgi:hypothetical protein